jgi:hypothetical protein
MNSKDFQVLFLLAVNVMRLYAGFCELVLQVSIAILKLRILSFMEHQD